MPIDIKWVRNHSDQVQEWQILRGKHHLLKTSLPRTLELDQQSRQGLQSLNQQRRRIKQISNLLRPRNNSNNSNNENGHDSDITDDTLQKEKLLSERSLLQQEILLQELHYTRLCHELNQTLATLASPVDLTILQDFQPYDKDHKVYCDYITTATTTMASLMDSHVGWNVAQAMTAYTRFHFGRIYPQSHSLMEWNNLPGSTTNSDNNNVCDNSSNQGDNLPDTLTLEQDAWGIKNIPIMSTASKQDLPAPSSSSSSSHASPSPMEERPKDSTTMGSSPSSSFAAIPPPSWIKWACHTIPRKSIWGAKQLPQFTLLRGTAKVVLQEDGRNNNNNKKHPKATATLTASSAPATTRETTELFAMTSGTTWDARKIQLELVEQLVHFYESLLCPTTTTTTTAESFSSKVQLVTKAVRPTELEMHELSRIVIVAVVATAQDGDQQHQIREYPLGWVSNFGDAAARACEITFKGGGLQKSSKEYVYWVHASIVGPHTIEALLHCNIVDDHPQVAVANCLKPFLIPDPSLSVLPGQSLKEGTALLSVPLAVLMGNKSTESSALTQPWKDPPLLPVGPNVNNNQILGTGTSDAGKQQGKFALWDACKANSLLAKEQIRAEASACPFDFLLGV